MGGIGGISFGSGQMPNMSQMKDRMFSKADANGDAGISLEEFQNVGKNMPMGKNDTDGTKAKEAFGKIDSDQNGSLSKDEMNAFGDKMTSEMQGALIDIQSMLSGGGQGGGGSDLISMLTGGKGSGSADPFSMFGGEDQEDMFKSIDSDSDGNISEDEFNAFGDKMKEKMSSQSGGSSDMLMQALSSYQSGSNGSSNDLTQKLLDMLKQSDASKDENKKTEEKNNTRVSIDA